MKCLTFPCAFYAPVFDCPSWRSKMTRDRFLQILACLCFTSDIAPSPDVPRNDPRFDRLFKINPILAPVLASCKALYHMGKEVSVDEMMVKCRGTRQHKPTLFLDVVLLTYTRALFIALRCTTFTATYSDRVGH
jgi:hypothetical protein